MMFRTWSIASSAAPTGGTISISVRGRCCWSRERRATPASRIAIEAAQAIGIRFASVDVVRVGGEWKVLEINSGVMMEALGKLHPELVHATYNAALDKVFE